MQRVVFIGLDRIAKRIDHRAQVALGIGVELGDPQVGIDEAGELIERIVLAAALKAAGIDAASGAPNRIDLHAPGSL